MNDTDFATLLSAVDQRSKSNSHRIDALERQMTTVNALTTSVALLEQKVDNIGEKVDSLCKDVKEIKGKPGQKWESLVSTVLKILVSAAVGFLLAKIGL